MAATKKTAVLDVHSSGSLKPGTGSEGNIVAGGGTAPSAEESEMAGYGDMMNLSIPQPALLNRQSLPL